MEKEEMQKAIELIYKLIEYRCEFEKTINDFTDETKTFLNDIFIRRVEKFRMDNKILPFQRKDARQKSRDELIKLARKLK